MEKIAESTQPDRLVDTLSNRDLAALIEELRDEPDWCDSLNAMAVLGMAVDLAATRFLVAVELGLMEPEEGGAE